MKVVRLYRRLLDLLPRTVSVEERDAIAATFVALYADAGSVRRRLRILLVSFGGLAGLLVREWSDPLVTRKRARRGRQRMSGRWSLFRQSVRGLARSPAFAVSVVLLVALGTGSVTAIFSVVDHVVLRPLPYPEADRLVKIRAGSHSGPTFERLSGMRTLDAVAGVSIENANLTGGPEPVRVRDAVITPAFFALFSARPAVGRLPAQDDFESGDGVVLSYGAWVRLFGEGAGVVGRSVHLDGVERRVIGVVGVSFVPPEALGAEDVDVWRPVDWTDERFRRDNYTMFEIAGRLSAGASIAQAQDEADALAERRAEADPALFVYDGRPMPLPVTELREATVGALATSLGQIFAAVTLLLLVACANVAHLFLARSIERASEMSVRRALGAGTGVLAWQVGIESVVLGLAGAFGGATLAFAGVGVFRVLAQGSIPRLATVGVDARVLGFALVVGVATTLLFGMLPALRLAIRKGGTAFVAATGRGGTPTRRANGVRGALVIAEVALSLVLAAQAAWLIRGFVDLRSVDLGFRTADVWTLPLTVRGIETPEEWYRRMDGIRESLAAVPGVRAATFGLEMPLEQVGGGRCCWSDTPDFGSNEGAGNAMLHAVDADYFDLFALHLVTGRTWTRSEVSALSGAGSEGDPAGVAPVVISEPLAVRVFGAAEPALGRTVRFSSRTFTVIGVVADNRHYGPDQEHGAAIYLSAGNLRWVPGRAHMAVLADPVAGLPRALSQAVWRVEPDLPVPEVRSMSDRAAAATARIRFVSGLFSAFGAIALVLAAGGLAGTLLYAVRMRRRELGIRIALGATPARVEWSVIRQGLSLAAAGVVVGGAGAWSSGRLLEGLAGTPARGSGSFALSVAVLLGVALAASWLPARKASATNPLDTLNAD